MSISFEKFLPFLSRKPHSLYRLARMSSDKVISLWYKVKPDLFFNQQRFTGDKNNCSLRDPATAMKKAKLFYNLAENNQPIGDLEIVKKLRHETFEKVTIANKIEIKDTCTDYWRMSNVNERLGYNFDEHIYIPSREELGLPSEDSDKKKKYYIEVNLKGVKDKSNEWRWSVKPESKSPESKQKKSAKAAFEEASKEGFDTVKATEIEGFFERLPAPDQFRKEAKVTVDGVNEYNTLREINDCGKLENRKLGLHRELDKIFNSYVKKQSKNNLEDSENKNVNLFYFEKEDVRAKALLKRIDSTYKQADRNDINHMTIILKEGRYFDKSEHASSNADKDTYVVHSLFCNKDVVGEASDKSMGMQGVAELECAGLRDGLLSARILNVHLREFDGIKRGWRDTPSAVLIEGTKRVAKLESMSELATLDSTQAETVNWVAMSAPDLRKNNSKAVTRATIAADLLTHAFAAMTLAKTNADKLNKDLVFKSGLWGAGAFQNEPAMVYAAQILAAKLAGVNRFEFYCDNWKINGNDVIVKTTGIEEGATPIKHENLDLTLLKNTLFEKYNTILDEVCDSNTTVAVERIISDLAEVVAKETNWKKYGSSLAVR